MVVGWRSAMQIGVVCAWALGVVRRVCAQVVSIAGNRKRGPRSHSVHGERRLGNGETAVMHKAHLQKLSKVRRNGGGETYIIRHSKVRAALQFGIAPAFPRGIVVVVLIIVVAIALIYLGVGVACKVLWPTRVFFAVVLQEMSAREEERRRKNVHEYVSGQCHGCQWNSTGRALDGVQGVPLRDKNRTRVSEEYLEERGRDTEDNDSNVDRAEDAKLIRLFEEAILALEEWRAKNKYAVGKNSE